MRPGMHDLRLAVPVGVAWAVLAAASADASWLPGAATAAAPVAVALLLIAARAPERAASALRLAAVGVGLAGVLMALPWSMPTTRGALSPSWWTSL